MDLPFTDQARNWGLTIDTNLRFNEHLKLIFKRAYLNLRLIFHSMDIVDKKT